jgi:chemotaxis protein MotB
MMAFFLLMWLLNATTEDQRKGLADYFSPNSVLSHASSGSGEPFGGHTAYDDGAMVSDRGATEIVEGKHAPLTPIKDSDKEVYTRALRPPTDKQGDVLALAPDPARIDPAQIDPAQTDPALIGQVSGGKGLGQDQDGNHQPTQAEIAAEKARQEKVAFEKAADDIQQAVRADPALADLAKQLAIDMTPEGLRIQIMDEVKSPMFASGSAEPNDRARELLRKVAPVLLRLPEAISIAGYTDASPYTGQGKTNWELSSDRANTARRLLTDGGLPETRIRTVTGHADRDPLLPAEPFAAANRRIAIVVLRNVQPPDAAEAAR